MKDNDKALIIYNSSKLLSDEAEDTLWICLDALDLPPDINHAIQTIQTSKDLLELFNDHKAKLTAIIDNWIDKVLDAANDDSANIKAINIVDEQLPNLN